MAVALFYEDEVLVCDLIDVEKEKLLVDGEMFVQVLSLVLKALDLVSEISQLLYEFSLLRLLRRGEAVQPVELLTQLLDVLILVAVIEAVELLLVLPELLLEL